MLGESLGRRLKVSLLHVVREDNPGARLVDNHDGRVELGEPSGERSEDRHLRNLGPGAVLLGGRGVSNQKVRTLGIGHDDNGDFLLGQGRCDGDREVAVRRFVLGVGGVYGLLPLAEEFRLSRYSLIGNRLLHRRSLGRGVLDSGLLTGGLLSWSLLGGGLLRGRLRGWSGSLLSRGLLDLLGRGVF